MQDNDWGTIIGRRSFGKGLVQRQLDLMDGSALRLTIARYFTPTGRCIQKPCRDRENGFEEYYAESHNRYFNGEMEEEDSIPFVDTLKYITPEGKIVYGGGGIMPDVFVPLNSDKNLDFYYDLIQKGLIFTYAFEYTDSHRNDLLKYTKFEEFNKQFEISTVLFTDFIEFARKKWIKESTEEISYAEERGQKS
ncbi:MAG: S41 family peptidase [Bacteroidales bacterium]